MVFAVTDWIAAPAVDRSLREVTDSRVCLSGKSKARSWLFARRAIFGDPLLLIHGFLGSSYDFNQLLRSWPATRQGDRCRPESDSAYLTRTLT
jgi:pimeloyl-ACP methyl ester carboxylesterase